MASLRLQYDILHRPNVDQLHPVIDLFRRVYPEDQALPSAQIASSYLMCEGYWHVASDGYSPIGAAGLHQMRDSSAAKTRVDALLQTLHRNSETGWEAYLLRRKADFDKTRITRLDSIVPQSAKAAENDVYLSGLTVLPEHRRQGVGTELAQRRLRMAMELGANSVYVTCADPGPSVNIFLKLGFQTLMRIEFMGGQEGLREMVLPVKK